MENKKVCFASSSGGHYEQLLMLKPLMEKYDSFIVTEQTKYSSATSFKTYYLTQVNREEKAWWLHILTNLLQSLRIFSKEKPDIVISTGVLATIPICLISKFFGKKIIYIESFAKTTSPTMTGKLLYKFADQFYVQWSSMKKVYPNSIYLGSIY